MVKIRAYSLHAGIASSNKIHIRCVIGVAYCQMGSEYAALPTRSPGTVKKQPQTNAHRLSSCQQLNGSCFAMASTR